MQKYLKVPSEEKRVLADGLAGVGLEGDAGAVAVPGQVVVVDGQGVVLVAHGLAQGARGLLQAVVLLEGGMAALRQEGLVRLERGDLLQEQARHDHVLPGTRDTTPPASIFFSRFHFIARPHYEVHELILMLASARRRHRKMSIRHRCRFFVVFMLEIDILAIFDVESTSFRCRHICFSHWVCCLESRS